MDGEQEQTEARAGGLVRRENPRARMVAWSVITATPRTRAQVQPKDGFGQVQKIIQIDSSKIFIQAPAAALVHRPQQSGRPHDLRVGGVLGTSEILRTTTASHKRKYFYKVQNNTSVLIIK